MEEKQQRISAIVIGAGSRGFVYSNYALDFPNKLKIVGVAEPRPIKRKRLQQLHSIDEKNVYEDWKTLASRNKFADAVIIATPDALHKDPAVAFAKKGYHILLEKPMAVTLQDCELIQRTCEENRVVLAVCHVMRYTPANKKIKQLIESGAIGDVVNIQHCEPIGYFHFAHSYVRGNWRKTSESSFSLLAKSCHDIDIIRYWMGSKVRCVRVQSFGGLNHFRPQKKPPEAKKATRCMDCENENNCAFSAKKIYLDAAKNGNTGWPVSIIVDDEPTIANVTQALLKGPYGRCVYECDNDVCDHQVVNMEFQNGATSSFTMVAFTEKICERETKIFGTRGELTYRDHRTIEHFDFLSETKRNYDVWDLEESRNRPKTRLTGHDYADFYVMDAFVKSVARNDPSLVLTGGVESLLSHNLVFSAEYSRLNKCVATLDKDHNICDERSTNTNKNNTNKTNVTNNTNKTNVTNNNTPSTKSETF